MIRRAQPTDIDAIRALIAQLDYEPPPNLEEKILRHSTHPDEVLLVYQLDAAPQLVTGYQLDATIVGFLSLHFIPQIALAGDFARISYFAVDNKARSHGVGRELEAYITTLARERNCDRIEVHCHSRRADAHRFYERQGYEESPKYFTKRLDDTGHFGPPDTGQ